MTTEVSVRDSLSFNYSPDFCFFLKHFSHWFNCIVTIHIQSKFRWEESLSRNEISIENVCLFRKYFFPWASEAYTLTFPASLIAAMILTWSSMRSLPKEQMTMSTCLMALTRLWWSFMSPWREKGVVWWMVWKEKMERKRWREEGTYLDEKNSRILEVLKEFLPGFRICSGDEPWLVNSGWSVPNQHIGRITCLHTCPHNVSSNGSCRSQNEDSVFSGHEKRWHWKKTLSTVWVSCFGR